MSEFSFPDHNPSKYQWIYTKLGVYIDIVKIWFGIVDRQISSIFDMSVKYQWIFTKLGTCMCIALILWRSALRLLMSNLSILTMLSARITSVFYFQDNNLSKYQWIFTCVH